MERKSIEETSAPSGEPSEEQLREAAEQARRMRIARSFVDDFVKQRRAQKAAGAR